MIVTSKFTVISFADTDTHLFPKVSTRYLGNVYFGIAILQYQSKHFRLLCDGVYMYHICVI